MNKGLDVQYVIREESSRLILKYWFISSHTKFSCAKSDFHLYKVFSIGKMAQIENIFRNKIQNNQICILGSSS